MIETKTMVLKYENKKKEKEKEKKEILLEYLQQALRVTLR